MLIANAGLPAWQAIFLIILSFGSLAIALYCLLFMVPLKKFVQRIESLGGGMDGIKKHLSGVEARLEKELQRIESFQSDRMDQIAAESETRSETADVKIKDALDAIRRLESTFEKLDDSVEAANRRMEEGMSRHANVEGRLRELRRDMAVQAEESQGKLQKEVRESFYELEATILSTLEVLRDELLPPKKDRPVQEPVGVFSAGRQKGGSRADEDRETESKIISAGPLFSRSEPPVQHSDDDESENGDEMKT